MNLPDPIKNLLESYCGINYEVIGNTSLEFLIRHRRTECHLPTNDDYFKFLLTNHQEFNTFVEGLLVPETWFFRDTNPFVHLAAFSKTFDKNETFFRVLSIACATGEEPYSIAITLLNSGWPTNKFSIYGVDLSQKFLEIAQKGIYSQRSFNPHDPCNKSKYFDQIDPTHFSVKNNVSQSVHFIHGNIIDSNLFKDSPPFHAIFARNILIYLSIDARKKALDNIDRLLIPNGELFLGHADNISHLTTKFIPTGHPSAFAFKKSSTPITPPHTSNKTIQKIKSPHLTKSLPKPPQKPSNQSTPTPKNFLDEAQQLANQALFSQAKSYIKKHLKINGPTADAYFLIGQIFAAQNNLDSAEEAYKKAIYLDNNHSNALFQLKLLYIGKGDEEQAKILHERLIRIENNQ